MGGDACRGFSFCLIVTRAGKSGDAFVGVGCRCLGESDELDELDESIQIPDRRVSVLFHVMQMYRCNQTRVNFQFGLGGAVCV